MSVPRTSSLLTLLASVVALAAPPARAQTTWFPLEVGNHWVYADEKVPANTRSVSVKGLEGDVFTLEYQGTEFLVTADLDIVLPGEGPGVYYRFEDESWLHRDFQGCDDLRILTVTSRDETVRTPFGEFTGCLRIQYEGGPCADAGTFEEWWAPEVGRVKWVEGSFGGPRTFVLQDFFREEPEPTFRRGDADGTGTVELTDAVLVLNWLFLGSAAPGCADAADANDDGKVDLSDPVQVLGFLFLGSAAPPSPGPETCGDDPTDDDLPYCRDAGCESAGFTGG
jgi:diadenosine tetraphosphatase ApaH/serine/threonine PP2A family protein phosphatase